MDLYGNVHLIRREITSIIVGIKYGISNPSYPVFSGIKYYFDKAANTYKYVEGLGEYIPYSMFLMETASFYLLACVTAASISFMISVLSNSTGISMSLGVILHVGLTYIVCGTTILSQYAQYIYVSYFRCYELFTGRIAETLNNNNITPLLGAIQMVVILILTYAISCTVFIRKDI